MNITKTPKWDHDPTFEIIGCALEVHSLLGPGLLESAYEQCLAFELAKIGLQFKAQASMPLEYKDIKLDCGYRLDLIIENLIIVEIKAVEQLLQIHQAQLLTYMKLSRISLGLLINFNATSLKNGIRRFVL